MVQYERMPQTVLDVVVQYERMDILTTKDLAKLMDHKWESYAQEVFKDRMRKATAFIGFILVIGCTYLPEYGNSKDFYARRYHEPSTPAVITNPEYGSSKDRYHEPGAARLSAFWDLVSLLTLHSAEVLAPCIVLERWQKQVCVCVCVRARASAAVCCAPVCCAVC